MNQAVQRVHFDHPAHSIPLPWQARQPALLKLLPSLSSFLPPSSANDPSLLTANTLGYTIERAQVLHAQTSSTLTDTQSKLLNRVIKAHLDPSLDLVLLRNIADSESGSVHLVKTKLSSVDSINQSNLYILKSIPKQAATRLHQHISPLAELSILLHSRTAPSAPIPTLHASFQSLDALHLLIRFLPAGSLADYIQARPAPPEALVRHWAAELVLALAWLHDKQWTHRDIKPSNLLLDHHGHVLLADFGAAAPLIPRAPPRLDQYLSSTRNAQVSYQFTRFVVPKKHRSALVGTCDYIAPEVLHAHLHAVLANMDSPASSSSDDDDDQQDGWYGNEVDYWSLGITLYELVYGQPAFFCQSIAETYDKIVSHKESLVVPSVTEWTDQSTRVRLSSGLLSFLKSLIECRDVRIGCGEEGVEEVKRHGWFEEMDWARLRSCRVAMFGETVVDVNQLGTSVCSQSGGGGDGERFHFSAFFGSSPGLSGLHSPAGSEGVSGEGGGRGGAFWGFTYLPGREEFEGMQEESKGRLKSSLKAALNKPSDDRFVTPVRPRIGAGQTAGLGTAARVARLADGAQRVMSGTEEMMALVDCVELTAKKSGSASLYLQKKKKSLDLELDLDLDGIESRVSKLVRDCRGGIERCDEFVERVSSGGF